VYGIDALSGGVAVTKHSSSSPGPQIGSEIYIELVYLLTVILDNTHTLGRNATIVITVSAISSSQGFAFSSPDPSLLAFDTLSPSCLRLCVCVRVSVCFLFGLFRVFLVYIAVAVFLDMFPFLDGLYCGYLLFVFAFFCFAGLS
jgi:hypothetical protein